MGVKPRHIAIHLPYLLTDWQARRRPDLRQLPYAVCEMERGRKLIRACNIAAEHAGICVGMAQADARALEPGLLCEDYEPQRAQQILQAMADWCLRYTPCVQIDAPNGLILDVTGCAHLFGGETPLQSDIGIKLNGLGYTVRTGMADTIGAAWALSRFGRLRQAGPGQQRAALTPLPIEALRLDDAVTGRLADLGLHQVGQLYELPRPQLARRFGPSLLLRLDQALGDAGEALHPHVSPPVYHARLPCLEGIFTAEGIQHGLGLLLATLCAQMQGDGKGARQLVFSAIRVDGQIERIEAGTSRASAHPPHLFRLLNEKIGQIAPGPGIEIFVLEAPLVDDIGQTQNAMFGADGLDHPDLPALVDRLSAKLEEARVNRYLPQASHVPERAAVQVHGIGQAAKIDWPARVRPVHILPRPEPIEVMALMPDYPPVRFRHRQVWRQIKRAEGPERIEPEWWIARGMARDYYRLEDDAGRRYWIFRAGQYQAQAAPQWYLHGFFA